MMHHSLRVPVSSNTLLDSVNDSDFFGEIELFQNPQIDLVSNKRFDSQLIAYTKQYDQSQAYSERFQQHMREVLEIVKSRVPVGSKVVEIGCGHGHFIELMQNDGHFSEVTGFDAIYSGSNPAIHARYLTEKDKIEADIVVIRHVVEHVTDPYAFLEMLKTIFGNPIVYIEVPNYEWILSKGKFYEIFYEHVHYFKPSTFKHLFSSLLASGIFFDDQYQYALASLQHLDPQFSENFHTSSQWQALNMDELFEHANHFFSGLRYYIKNRTTKIYVWGAASKGCMILLYLQRYEYADHIGYAIDINPKKYGKLLPITKTEIHCKEDFFNDVNHNDVLIVSNEAYLTEIKKEIMAQGINVSVLDPRTIHNLPEQKETVFEEVKEPIIRQTIDQPAAQQDTKHITILHL